MKTILLSWFYSRGGRYRPIYYLGFTVEVGDNDHFRGGRWRSFYYLGFTVEVGDNDHFIILILQ